MRLKVKYLILLIATTTTLNVVKNKIPSLVIESKKLSDTQNYWNRSITTNIIMIDILLLKNLIG